MPVVSPIKVVIADDQVIVAEGIAVMLQQQEDFEVLGIAPNGEKMLHLLNSVQPHLVLLDLNMPVMDGFETCKHIREKFPAIVVVALTTYDDDKMRQQIKAAGAAGMLLKYTSSAELAGNLRLVMATGNNGQFTSPETESKTETDGQTNKCDAFLLKHKISEREMEVVKLIAEGLNSEQIGQKLFLSEHTIKTHRKNILEKLNLSNTAELVNFAHKNKLV
jgi:two-component system, NarL family, nitrate/nitrite response regulator NarL